jgi:hypothetical protein
MTTLARFRNLIISSILLIVPAAHGARPSDQAYILLARVVTPSITFSADVWLENATKDTVAVSVTLIPYNAPPVPVTMRNVIRLQPGQRMEYVDFLGSVMGQQNATGLVVLNGCLDGADCRGDSTAAKAGYRDINVHSRIYSFATGVNGGTVGQDFDGWPWYDYGDASHSLTITGIRASNSWQTNIGLVNASQYSSTALLVSLYDGPSDGLRAQVTVSLKPSETRQQNVLELFPTFGEWSRLNRGRASTNAVITITQSSVTPTADAAANGCADGCPAMFAYGSLVDSLTNDATTLRAEFNTPLSDTQIASLYATPPPLSSATVSLQERLVSAPVETPEACMARTLGPRSKLMVDTLSEAIRVCGAGAQR